MPDPFPDEVAPQDSEEARRRADAIREFLRADTTWIDNRRDFGHAQRPAQPEALSLLQHI